MITNGLICMSHLRWDFVFQRPQHLMSRWAKHTRVYYFEEPIRDGARCRLDWSTRADGLRVIVPHLPTAMSPAACQVALMQMIDQVVERESLKDFVLWYYTPDGAPLYQPFGPQRGGLRLHGRALGLSGRAVFAGRTRGAPPRAGRLGHGRRAESLSF